MKIVEISAVETGSTGRIMLNMADFARKKGFSVYTFSGTRSSYCKRSPPLGHTRVSTLFDYFVHRTVGQISGYSDFVTRCSSRKLIACIEKIKPDLIHMHIMHGCFVNNEILMQYFSELRIPFVWTFHDCWAFTGRCPYFEDVACYKWKNGCYGCPYPHSSYPNALRDVTDQIWSKKKSLFKSIKNLSIVTPSQWLANLTRQSFFSSNDIYVINNGIDLSIFKVTESDSRSVYNCSNKFVILGVANKWNYRKGLDLFINLAQDLDRHFQIVLVGTDKFVDSALPSSIISIHNTHNQKELAELYSMADVFVNPTREDNFPTVNIEALACGTPVITFDTGGSAEIIDTKCGISVEKDNYDVLRNAIVSTCKHPNFLSSDCIRRAQEFDMNKKFSEYIKLYEELTR